MPALAVAFLKRYCELLQEVLEVRLIALLQLSLDGCAKTSVENNKEMTNKKTVF